MMRTSLLLIVMLSLFGCGQAEDRQSDSQLHFITFGPGVSGLIGKVKKRNLLACLSGHSSTDRGLWVKNIESVILKWVEPLRHLSADQLTNTVEIIDGRGKCDTDIVIAQNTHSNTSIGSYPTVRMSPSGYFASFNVLLHEFGHAFALGDTYQNGTSGNCQPGQPQAVMCNTGFAELQKDDVAGLEEIFKRTFPRDEPNTGGVVPTEPLKVNFALALGAETSRDKFEVVAGIYGLDARKSLAISYCLADCELANSWKKMEFSRSKSDSVLFSAGLHTVVDKMNIQIRAEDGSKLKKSAFKFSAT